MKTGKEPTQYELDQKAERILILQTLKLSDFEVSIFLANYGITREEYEYLKSKYSRLIELYNEEKSNE